VVLSWATRYFPVRYDGGVDTEKGGTKELWESLDNEPANAFAAFGCFDSLDARERSVLAAYRIGVRPDAKKPSDTWAGWSREFAWQERALAHDKHLDGVRRKGVEEAIEEEPESRLNAQEAGACAASKGSRPPGCRWAGFYEIGPTTAKCLKRQRPNDPATAP
jgi:hypothetical protein